MSDDIVKRLRAWQHEKSFRVGTLLLESADEIERLTAERDALRAELNKPKLRETLP